MRAIDIIKNPRKLILEILKDYTIEQLNKIPDGFNNNMIWNLGHMIATTQGLCYKRSGVPIHVSDAFFETFKSGSKPERFISEAEYDEIKTLLFSTLEDIEKDYDAKLFQKFDPVVTRYNVDLNNIDEALAFIPFHDGLHIGYIMSLRKLV
jgi:hypothetical protein